MKVGFTGARNGMTSKQWERVYALLHEAVPDQFHHGDCVGADAQAHDIAEELEIYIVAHPPDIARGRAWRTVTADEERPTAAYLKRDHDIVDETDELIACPKGFTEERRSGTWATIRYAKRSNKKVTIVWPDGSYEYT